MESIYWVVSRDCNQRCCHCYNDSEPGAPGLTLEQASVCVTNLPDPDDVPVDRIILSGGEVLVWPELLFHTLRELHGRYTERTDLYVQTNGDLLDPPMLERLLDHHVKRIDVSSMDKFHPKSTRDRRGYLTDLFESHGMVSADAVEGPSGGSPRERARPVYCFWGATPEMWIGPLWPRGRARRGGSKHVSRAGPEHRFCAMWSGAIHFLNYREAGSEVNLQLGDVYPCCPMTAKPIGSVLVEPLIEILDRCARHPVFRALNEGRPEAMGECFGISEAQGFERSRELGNHCLWCDEFFLKYAENLLYPDGMTSRSAGISAMR
jgi:hypothetical protein